MQNILLLFLCLAIGLGYRFTGHFPEQAAQSLNAFVLNVCLPALALVYIPTLPLNVAVLVPMSMGWLLFGGAWLGFHFLGKWQGWDRQTVGCLILASGLGNTAFLGLAFVEMFWGTTALPYAILADQMGSFLVFSTLGIYVATQYAVQTHESRPFIQHVLRFPTFWALMFALACNVFHVPVPFLDGLKRIGSAMIPAAFVAIGLQFSFRLSARAFQQMVWGLGYKMLLAPLLLWGLYALWHSPAELSFRATILEAAMPPMVSAGILAMQYDLRPDLANAMISVGLGCAFISLTMWFKFLG